MRGKRLHQHDGSGRGGITPARAGKTRPSRNRGCNRGDHPRACGENHIGTVAQGQAEGSPPRVRGKPVAAINIATSEGITPARAGKTYAFFCSTARSSDHPRACGENFKGCRWGSPSPGSPPRVRGKHAESVEAAKTAGITPARAGKTELFLVHRHRQGITPARAGKTRGWTAVKAPWRDHPRACGENTLRTMWSFA